MREARARTTFMVLLFLFLLVSSGAQGATPRLGQDQAERTGQGLHLRNQP